MDRWRQRLDQAISSGMWKAWGPFLVLIALGAIAFGVFSIRDEIRFAREGRTATATVITKDIDRIGRESHYVVYRFQTPDGRTFEGQSDVSEAKWHLIRDTIEIRYLESDPTQSRAAGDPIKLLTDLALPLGVAVVAGALGLYLLVAGFRTSRRRPPEPTT